MLGDGREYAGRGKGRGGMESVLKSGIRRKGGKEREVRYEKPKG
jgi:hypothetical protein